MAFASTLPANARTTAREEVSAVGEVTEVVEDLVTAVDVVGEALVDEVALLGAEVLALGAKVDVVASRARRPFFKRMSEVDP